MCIIESSQFRRPILKKNLVCFKKKLFKFCECVLISVEKWQHSVLNHSDRILYSGFYLVNPHKFGLSKEK